MEKKSRYITKTLLNNFVGQDENKSLVIPYKDECIGESWNIRSILAQAKVKKEYPITFYKDRENKCFVVRKID